MISAGGLPCVHFDLEANGTVLFSESFWKAFDKQALRRQTPFVGNGEMWRGDSTARRAPLANLAMCIEAPRNAYRTDPRKASAVSRPSLLSHKS